MRAPAQPGRMWYDRAMPEAVPLQEQQLTQELQLQPADWFLIIAPLAGGVLAFGAGVAAMKGKVSSKASEVVMLTWGLMSGITGAALAYREIHRSHEMARLTELVRQQGAPGA